MSLDELIEWSLTDKGKAALLAQLKNQRSWLYHDSWKSNFDKIRANGLEPRDPSQGGPISARFKALRDVFPTMVSFAQTPNLLPTKGLDDKPLFTLALPSGEFTGFFLDWSFWGHAQHACVDNHVSRPGHRRGARRGQDSRH
ncbi:hypothetical protein EN833_15135 [Mesorhizobium sp. M4B.F.Ca.ET.190.01.1.1]|uniref:hypothetical protein n=1 Tax=unclassified Mesorhizobium TaxID=325217 RepID=UPI0010930533|nr:MULTISPECIES: hypothetical protein [unclassified Mesorhizobium]TGR08795.1 hypothetical protein EN843_15130 [Mesorhizobium sp. M4B.F.Ca.ET.200.01.1.1]TGS18272.1 hypothetical protein EN833_15135 [Mesorhizobium sp. M4B.F.Ca.ET.190.01.1.1]TGT30085.1 hypothetical protein EN815_15115 [Mesorhizobium sp. M4B.F.Ca.ET.172.01.1.1]